jgi:hypothetical protein
MTAFWDIESYILVKGGRRFRGAYCLHHQGGDWGLQWWWRQYASLKRRSTSTSLRDLVSQKVFVFLLDDVRIWNVALHSILIIMVIRLGHRLLGIIRNNHLSVFDSQHQTWTPVFTNTLITVFMWRKQPRVAEMAARTGVLVALYLTRFIRVFALLASGSKWRPVRLCFCAR